MKENPLLKLESFGHIIVDGGKVILEGAVGTELEKRMAANLVEEYTDAFSVDNELQVPEK